MTAWQHARLQTLRREAQPAVQRLALRAEAPSPRPSVKLPAPVEADQPQRGVCIVDFSL